MRAFRQNLNWATAAVLAVAVIAAPAQADLTGQLGRLDLTKDYGLGAGVNPATGSPWLLDDVYQLTYVTSTLRDSTSSDIFDYNTFVQADAEAAGIGASVGATWFVLGSTTTVDAKDNAVVTGSVFNISNSNYIAKDATDFWDFIWPAGNPVLTLAGDPKNTHSGTLGGGTGHPGFQLGNPWVRLAWTGWGNWSAAWRGEAATEPRERVAVSVPLRIVADVVYWDLNGATEGAGATPDGTWDAAGAYWNSAADGTGDPNAWLPGHTAAFGAGGDATGTYTVTVNDTQDISGLSFEEGTVTLAPGTDGVLRMVFSSTVDVASGLTATVQTPISEDATARSLVKRGEGTLILSGTNTYTGTTIVNEGVLALFGSPTGQSDTTVNGGGTLKLDYSTNDTSKIHDSAALALGGGTLELSGGAHTEVVASTTIAPGLSSVTRSSDSATLAMNVITAGPGIVDFAAAGIATTDNTNANGILGPWATIGNADWAQNSTDANDGPITAYTGYTDIAATGDTITDGSATNVRLNTEGAGGNLALSADATAVNTLLQNTAFAATVDTAAKSLQVGGIMIGAGQEALTIGAAAGDGTLTVGSDGGVLYLNNTNAAKTLTVNAVIADNTSPSTLATAGNVLLQGVNTYTGATYVNAGTLEIGGAGQLAGGAYSANITIARGATFKYNSDANQILSDSISGSGGLLKDATGALTLSGANTYTGATVISGGALQIGSGAGTGSLSTSSAITNNANLVFNRSNVITQGVDFANGISGSGDVTQAGAGTLVLAGTNTYTGMTIVNAGTLVPSATSSLPGYDSAGKVLFDGGTVRLLVGGSGWATADVDTLLANATKTSGALGIDTSNSDLAQWTAFTPANLGALNLMKLGTNTLALDQANTHTGGTTLSAGTLAINHVQALGTGTFTIAGPGTVQANGAIVTANPVVANSNFTIAGTGSLTLGDMTVNINQTITNANTTTTTTIGGISGDARNLVFAGNGDTVVTGVVATGTGTLTKQGTGTLSLLNASTYTGNTAVTDGTLVLDGSIAGSAVTVSNAGTRITGGEVKSLTITNGAGFIWGYGDGENHAMDITAGDLVLNDGWVLKLVDLGDDPQTTEQYDLFTFTGNYNGSAVTTPISLALDTNYTLDITEAGDWNVDNIEVVVDGGDYRVYVTGIGIAGLPGDADGDGDVDAADYIMVKTHFGGAPAVGTGGTGGDFDGDGTVDWDDLQTLMNAYNAGSGADTIPEPATLFIMLTAGLPAVLRRRRS